MTDLTFNDPDEVRAWDMYVAGYAAGAGIPFSSDRENILDEADNLILERRKRMAPEKVEREWIPHKPGDPMPCDGDDWVIVKFADGSDCRFQKRAKTQNWGYYGTVVDVIAWRPA